MVLLIGTALIGVAVTNSGAPAPHCTQSFFGTTCPFSKLPLNSSDPNLDVTLVPGTWHREPHQLRFRIQVRNLSPSSNFDFCADTSNELWMKGVVLNLGGLRPFATKRYTVTFTSKSLIPKSFNRRQLHFSCNP